MDLKEYFKENYPFLGKIEKVEPLSHNNINSVNHIFSVDKGKYVLRNFIDGSSPEKIEKICRILDFCLQEKVKTIEPIKNRNNNYVDKKRKIYLTKYYEGRTYQGLNSELKDTAKNLAILHLTLANNPIEYNFRINHNYYKNLTQLELNKIKKIIVSKEKQDEFDKKVIENFDYLTRLFLKNSRAGAQLKLKPKTQLIHYDFRPENVVFNKNKVKVILDFNAMRKGRQIEDVAFACFRFSCFRTNDINKIKRNMRIFTDSYLLINKEELNDLNIHLTNKILNRLSYILRKRYFRNFDLWSCDFEKNINLLKLAEKVYD